MRLSPLGEKADRGYTEFMQVSILWFRAQDWKNSIVRACDVEDSLTGLPRSGIAVTAAAR
jgi:hypothetical protein